MILDTILYIFFTFLIYVFSLLPPMTNIPVAFDESLNFLVPFFNQANSIFPISTVFTIFLLFLTIESVLLIYKVFNWIVNKLRGSG